jgi:CRP-like cAMP-binding protein
MSIHFPVFILTYQFLTPFQFLTSGGIMIRLFKKKIMTELERVYQDGDIIVREGDKGSEMYIIKSGSVKVTKKTHKGQITLTILSHGDFFGEMALFEQARRSATVSSIGETRLMVLHAGAFLYRLRQDPTLVFEMFQKMSKTIRRLTEELSHAIDTAKLPPDLHDKISAEAEFTQ